MESVSHKICAICGSKKYKRLDAETRFKKLDQLPEQFIVKCCGCGIVTRSPSLFDPLFNREAAVDVRRDEDFIGGDTISIAEHIKIRLDHAAGKVSGKTLLDIGCGSGALLVHAKKQGWSVCGTEHEPSAVEKLAAYGIPCFTGDLDEPDLLAMRFDLIHMNHVLEHVESPLRVLKVIGNLLKEDGLAIIEVPNEFSALTQRLRRILKLDGSSVTTYFQHEWYFTPQSLRDICEKANLSVMALNTPFRRSNNFIKDIVRAPAAAVGHGEVIEAYLTKR
ncbi:MAG: class I SAM-dependent methyltransferase [Chloracidobacterium sp.]|nr:class I SAM-dependent methyltransferase [Chloracidobacterium sp.]